MVTNKMRPHSCVHAVREPGIGRSIPGDFAEHCEAAGEAGRSAGED